MASLRLRRSPRGGRLRLLTVLIHVFDMRGSALAGPAPRLLHDFESSARRTGQDPSVVVRRERDRHVVLGRDPVAQLRHVHRVPRIHKVETSPTTGSAGSTVRQFSSVEAASFARHVRAQTRCPMRVGGVEPEAKSSARPGYQKDGSLSTFPRLVGHPLTRSRGLPWHRARQANESRWSLLTKLVPDALEPSR